MGDALSQFIDAMNAAGLSPADSSQIIADDKRRDYRLAGDPPSKKKGFYRLQVDGDFGFGYFGDWRTGDCINWHSTGHAQMTPEEKKAHKQRIADQKAKAEAEQLAQWEAAARTAQDFVLFLDEAVKHPYLDKKKIQAHGALISGKDLVLPMSDGETVWNYQRIMPDGEKRFLTGAKKTGAYFTIHGDDTICITEGFATGASVFEATGHTVIVAFDAGNLMPVASAVRKAHKGAQIILCADNDAWQRPVPSQERVYVGADHAKNVGIVKAKDAAEKTGALVAWPEFGDHAERPTDFNDAADIFGLEYVKNTVSAALPPTRTQGPAGNAAGGPAVPHGREHSHSPGGTNLPAAPEPKEPDQTDWRAMLMLTKKGDIIPRSTINILTVAEYDEQLAGVFRYDGFAKRIMVCKCPPWEDDDIFTVRPLQDYDYVRLEAYMEGHYKLNASKEKVADAIVSVSQLPKNAFNPASDYFKSLEWDGTPRVNEWLKKYVSDGGQPDSYLSLVGRKFLCGMAARAMSPGVKFDTMLILEGEQYAGKSLLSRILATINSVEYFLDDFRDIENKDSLMKMQGKLVVEFPEISAMRRAEINELKAFLTRTSDVFRPPYGRNTIEAGRQCVFIGTVNPEGPYLRDVTGNRRYWPVSCRHRLMLDDLKQAVPQLHAEAAHLVRQGEKLWLNDEEYSICTIEQDKRLMSDVWHDKVNEIVGTRTQISMDQVLSEMGIAIEKRTPMIQTRVNNVMISLGFHPMLIRMGGKPLRGYKKHGAQQELADNDEFISEW